jgi:transposase
VSDARDVLYVGVDWADTAHRVIVLNAARQVLHDWVVPHTGEGLAGLAARLVALTEGDAGRVAVALEMPRGPLVDALLERGCHVFAINPKQSDRFRDRFSPAGAKDDRRDARVLADALVTDRGAFRALAPEDPLVIRLRELSRVDAELQQELRRLTNRLRAQLQRFYVQPLALCPAADEPWLWALLALAPTPAAAARLRESRLARLLRTHHIRRVTAADVHAHLQRPALPVAPGVTEAASSHVALLLPQLHLLQQQRRACAPQIEQLLQRLAERPDAAEPHREHRDVTILRSLPGVGRTVAATMLAEASGPLAARDYHALRTQTGVAPVTQASGRRRLVQLRTACNRRLRQAVYHWARVSTQVDPLSRAHYTALRGRGHSHPRALRGVADRLLAILIAMLRTGTLYDASYRRAATLVA